MLKRYHHLTSSVLQLTDCLTITLGWLLAYWMRFHIPFLKATKGLPPFQQYAALIPFLLLIWLAVFSALHVYRPGRLLGRSQEILHLLKAHALSLLIFLALSYFLSEYHYSRGVILYYALVTSFGFIACRFVLRSFLRRLRSRGVSLRHVLAIGEGEALESLVKKMNQYPELGLRLIGVLSEKAFANFPLLGGYQDLKETIRKHMPDEVLIALPRAHAGLMDGMLKELRNEIIDIQIVSDLYEYITLGCTIESFDGLPLMSLNDSPLIGWKSIIKRLLDVVFSFLALILFSPFLLFIACVIKATSRGPIFYRQERMGLDGKVFQMIKFRSMQLDAEDQGAIWASPGDARRTSIGAFLRKTSLDEFPQFWNVLKGEMSLVGPRPERPVFVERFRDSIPHYMLRHKVKAGITGWAQVNGWRGNTSLDRRIEYDLFYIRNWSFMLDVKILFLTILKGFIHKNAY